MKPSNYQPQYQLIKEYPGSEPKGTIFTYTADWNCYGTRGKHRGEWNAEFFRNWSTYFKIV